MQRPWSTQRDHDNWRWQNPGMYLARAIAGRMPARLRDLVRPPFPAAARPWVRGSFAQTGEDLIVQFLFRDILGVSRPGYLDIGAYHPFHLSNTALLHLSGSSGINVEPDTESFELFRRHRPRDVNLNVGVGAEPGRLTFFRMSTPTLSTFSRADAERIHAEGEYRIEQEIDVQVRPVGDLLRSIGRDCPDLLSIDVEGNDLDILRTMPEWPGRPTVVCAETLTFAKLGTEQKVPEVAAVLGDLGYLPVAETYINTVFVSASAWGR